MSPRAAWRRITTLGSPWDNAHLAVRRTEEIMLRTLGTAPVLAPGNVRQHTVPGGAPGGAQGNHRRAYSGEVKLDRRHAWALLAIAAWNVVTYAQFTRALATTEEDRPVGYYVAHTVLIVVNLLIAAVLGRWGLRALRAQRVDR